MDINKLSFTITGDAGKATQSLDRLINTLGRLDKSFTRTATSGKGLVDVLQQINTIGRSNNQVFDTLNTQNRKTSTSMRRMTSSIRRMGTSLTRSHAQTKHVSNGMHTLGRATAGADTKLYRMMRRVAQLTFVIYGIRKALQGFRTGIQASIRYVENLNLFMVALGENTTKAKGFIDEMAESLYLDPARLVRVQGLFYQISEALGLSSEKAYTLSENFTKLAVDLASFFNLGIDEAVTKLQAGLVGETEPLRRIGIIITENNLAETARNLGIRKSIRNMTEMEKIQLRYVTALQQTKNAQTDLARTIKQPENLLRILKDQWAVLMRELGNVAIPVIQKLIPEIIGITVALQGFAKALAETMKYEAPEISNDLGGYQKTVADETEKAKEQSGGFLENMRGVLTATRETQSAMTGIDELNVINSKGGAVSSLFEKTAEDLADVSTIDIDMGEYDNMMDKASGIFDKYIKKWKGYFEAFGEAVSGSFSDTSEAWKTFSDTVFNNDNGLEEKLSNFRKVLDLVDDVISGILDGFTKTYEVAEKLWDNVIKPLGEFIIPEWMKSLGDGSVRNAIKDITFFLMLWKGLKFSAGFIAGVGKLITLGGKLSLLSGISLVIAGASIAPDVIDSLETGDWSDVRNKLLTALGAGLVGTVLTGGNVKAGKLAFTVAIALGLDITEIVPKLSEMAKNTDWSDLRNKLLTALGAGLVSTILTGGNIGAGALVFTVAMKLNLDIVDVVLTPIEWFKDVRKDVIDGMVTGKEAETVTGKLFNLGFAIGNEIKEGMQAGLEGAFDFIWKGGVLGWGIGEVLGSNDSETSNTSSPTDTNTSSPTDTKENTNNILNQAQESLINLWDIATGKKLQDDIARFKELRDKRNSEHKLTEGELKEYTSLWKSLSEGKIDVSNIPQMAEGGKPQKGSLFIAGEEGTELVGNFGNGTSVINQEQMKELGIPQFAGGANVPEGEIPGISIMSSKNLKKPLDQMKDLLMKSVSLEEQSSFEELNMLGDSGDKKGGEDKEPTAEEDSGSFTDQMVDLWNAIKDPAIEMWEDVSTYFDATFKDKSIVGGLLTMLDDAGGKILDMTKGIFEGVGKFAIGAFEKFAGDKGVQAIMTPKDGAGSPGVGETSETQQGIAGEVISGMLGDSWGGMILNLMKNIDEGIVTEFVNSLPTFIASGIDMLMGLLEGIMEALPELLTQIPVIIGQIVDLLTNKETIQRLINAMMDIVVAIVIALPDIILALVKAIPMIIGTLIEVFMDNIGMFLKLGVLIGVSIFEGLANIVVKGINWLIDKINTVLPKKWKIGKFGEVNVTESLAKDMGFADGGYPDQGQMFIAREAGAELVGDVGGRTAVMNNDQIVESVSRGVYEAVLKAMQEQQERDTVVNLDGKRVSERMDVVNRNKGLSFGMGGY